MTIIFVSTSDTRTNLCVCDLVISDHKHSVCPFYDVYSDTLNKRTDRRRERWGSWGTESVFERVLAKGMLCAIQQRKVCISRYCIVLSPCIDSDVNELHPKMNFEPERYGNSSPLIGGF